jgi:hypothetical protein
MSAIIYPNIGTVSATTTVEHTSAVRMPREAAMALAPGFNVLLKINATKALDPLAKPSNDYSYRRYNQIPPHWESRS